LQPIQPTPWFSVFFRKPWLASVAAAIPLILILGLVILYTFRIRQKKRIINKAKDELVATQKKLIEAEKYAQAKDIAGGFAHEIRNALFPARSWLSRLKKSAQGSLDQSEQVNMVNQAVARAINVTSMISQYTKLESEQNNERTNISKVLSDVVKGNSLRIEEQRVELDISCPEDIQALISRNHLYIIVNNLLLNSLDALADKNENSRIVVKCLDELDIIVLTVEDNGPGITKKDIGRIFDTFYSTKPTTGIGLGLAMTRKIVEMYKGSINVFSQPGIGAKFTVKLKRGDVFDVSSST
jgi:signal transduction histidine kinase